MNSGDEDQNATRPNFGAVVEVERLPPADEERAGYTRSFSSGITYVGRLTQCDFDATRRSLGLAYVRG